MADRVQLRDIKQQLNRWTRKPVPLILTMRFGRGPRITMFGNLVYQSGSHSFGFAMPKYGHFRDCFFSRYNEFKRGRTGDDHLTFVVLVRRIGGRPLETVMITEAQEGPLSLASAQAKKFLN